MSDLEDLLASADPAARRDDDPSSHHAKGQIYLRVVASRGEDMTRRHGHGVRWSRRLAVASFCLVVVVAVTAVTVAVTRPATTTALSEPSMHIAPLTDVSATPPGWVAVPFYSVQVSVPSAWHIQAPGESSCSSGGPGEGLLFLGEETGSGSLGGCSPTIATVAIVSATKAPIANAHRGVVNGIAVTSGWSSGPHGRTYVERALGYDVTAWGSMSAQVLGTLTHSPLSVVLNSWTESRPSGWRVVKFGGLAVAIPPTWAIQRMSELNLCGPPTSPDVLDLNSAQSYQGPVSCPGQSFGRIEHGTGLRIDSGPMSSREPTSGGSCRDQGGLRVCIDEPTDDWGYGFAMFTATVYPPGRAPDFVWLELGGSGLTALEVFDSLRPA